MIVQQARIDMAAQYQYEKTDVSVESRRSTATEGAPPSSASPLVAQEDTLSLSAEMDKLKLDVEAFIGRKIQLGWETPSATPSEVGARDPVEVTTLQLSERFEQASYQIQGQLTLSDGRTLDLDYQNSLTRYEVSFTFTKEVLDWKDPLMLELSSSAGPELTAQRYAFDLDADGSVEKIAFATGNSAFLALDKNDNGLIDNGTELFGAQSGNGFADLRLYDDDANGFIDKGDSVFVNLSLLRKDKDGQNQLMKLQEAGIGAIYLGYVATPFELRDNAQTPLARIRSSGFYVAESGAVGAVRQVDLAV